MQKRKNLIKVGVIGGLSVLVLAGAGGLVYANQSHQDIAEAQGYTNSSHQSDAKDAQVLGESTNNGPTPSQHNSPAGNSPTPTPKPASNTGSLTSSSINDQDGHETSNPPNDELVNGQDELNPENTYNPVSEKGFLVGFAKTQVGGQACGFPAGFCDWPYVTTVTVKDVGGNVVASMPTGQDGSFGFKLKPGTYTVEGAPGSEVYIAPNPQKVTITKGNTTNVIIFYQPMAMTN